MGVPLSTGNPPKGQGTDRSCLSEGGASGLVDDATMMARANWTDQEAQALIIRAGWVQGEPAQSFLKRCQDPLTLAVLGRALTQLEFPEQAFPLLQQAEEQWIDAKLDAEVMNRFSIAMVVTVRAIAKPLLPRYTKVLLDRLSSQRLREAWVHHLAYWTAWLTNNWSEAQAECRISLDLFHELGEHIPYVTCLHNMASTCHLVTPEGIEERLAWGRKAIDAARAYGLTTKEITGHANYLDHLLASRRHEDVCRYVAEVIAPLRLFALPHHPDWNAIDHNHACALMHLGHRDEATVQLEQAINKMIAAKRWVMAVSMIKEASECWIEQGDAGRAHTWMCRALDLQRQDLQGAVELEMERQAHEQKRQLEQEARVQVERSNDVLQQEVSRRTQSLRDEVERRRMAEARAVRLSITCPLTGIGNRYSLFDHLAKLSSNPNQAVSLLFFDLDGFKSVNDTWGHSVGDAFLRAVGEGLRDTLHRHGVVYRYGGDEFCLVVSNNLSDADLERISLESQDLIREVATSGGRRFRCSASVGAANFPRDANTVEDLVRCADMAAYTAKTSGPGQVRRYRPETDQETLWRRSLTGALDGAIAAGQIRCHYQLQWSADGLDVVGMEALARWYHPKLGVLSPKVFIDQAEDALHERAFGLCVLRSALMDRQRLVGRVPSDFRVAVNITAGHFAHPDFVSQVCQTCEAVGVPATMLEIELTERRSLSDLAQARQNMTELANMGVQLALDDFGTGFNSIVGMCTLAFHVVKVEKVFVDGVGRDPQANGVVQAMHALAKTLGMKVIAEGVEEPEQHAWLMHQGIDVMQGYLFHAPQAIQDVIDVIDARARALVIHHVT